MKVMMTKTAKGISRPDGAATMIYSAGQEYEATEQWQTKVLNGFIKMGVAHEIGGNAGPKETKKAAPRKATKKSAE
jgi:hypothetical protein